MKSKMKDAENCVNENFLLNCTEKNRLSLPLRQPIFILTCYDGYLSQNILGENKVVEAGTFPAL